MSYWYNVKTGQVEEGKQSLALDLVGPFDTRVEAEHALEKLAERSRAWEEEEREADN